MQLSRIGCESIAPMNPNISAIFILNQKGGSRHALYTLCSCVSSDLTFQANVFFARVKNSAVYVTVLEMRLNIIYAWSIL